MSLFSIFSHDVYTGGKLVCRVKTLQSRCCEKVLLRLHRVGYAQDTMRLLQSTAKLHCDH